MSELDLLLFWVEYENALKGENKTLEDLLSKESKEVELSFENFLKKIKINKVNT